MSTFSPPTDDLVVYADMWSPGSRLFRRIRPGARGRNVFQLNDGTYTEGQPPFWTDIQKVYYGGHVYELTADEVTSLTNAGYGDYIND
jgi:hypothetical protein